MPALTIEVEWIPEEGIRGPELAATWASLKIVVNDLILTSVADSADDQVRDHIYVSVYPLAEWLANNWWCLLHESDKRVGFEDRDFYERHSLTPWQEGYRYPDLRFVSCDDKTRVTWDHEGHQWPELRYLKLEGCEWIDKAEFRRTCAGFIDAVVERLASQGVRGTLLQDEWLAIQDADQDEREFCEAAGALGLDPYIISDADRDKILRLSRDAGGTA